MKILKIPLGLGSLGHNLGTKEAPDKVLEVFNNEIWTTESLKVTPTLRDLHIEEVNVKNEEDIVKAHEKIYSYVKKFGLGLYLGGDHSISYPCFKAFAQNFKNPGIIVFDAHPDVFEEYEYTTHQDWLKFLIEEGFVKGENVIVIAVRNADIEEIEYFKKKRVRFYLAKDLFMNTENICDAVMETAREWEALYLSLDIDSLDPAYAPGTGYIEPAGMTVRELLYFVQRLKNLKNLKAVDLVEINPSLDINGMTVKVGAKLLGELL